MLAEFFCFSFFQFLVNFTNLSWKEFNIIFNNINILSGTVLGFLFLFFLIHVFCLVPGVGGGVVVH